MNTLHAAGTTEPHGQLAAAPRPRPPAKRPADESEGVALTVIPAVVGALVGLGILVAVGLGLTGQAGGLAALGTALLGAQSAWYLSRASAFVAYVLLWWSMVLGLSITNRLARVWPGGPAATDLHKHASLLGLGFGLLHALVLLADQYIGYTLPQILIPFASASYRPLWVGLGQIGLYLMALIMFSFYVRRWIGARAWRLIHYLSFAVFALALIHGLFSGTDGSTPWAIWMYVSTGVSVLAMTVYRIVVHRRGAAPPTRLAAAQGGS
jgi:predicted ferric reductase